MAFLLVNTNMSRITSGKEKKNYVTKAETECIWSVAALIQL